MKKYLFVGIGGSFGAVSRFIIKNIDLIIKPHIPINTLLINITGSFLIALILTAALKGFRINENLKLLCTTGFLGGYTTFSTLCKEAFMLLNNGGVFSGIIYVLSSTVLGLLAVYLGAMLANKMLSGSMDSEGELEEAN